MWWAQVSHLLLEGVSQPKALLLTSVLPSVPELGANVQGAGGQKEKLN